MRPELAQDPDGPTAVVWHIAAAKGVVDMLCGAQMPATASAGRWQQFPERPCTPCHHAFRQLIAPAPGGAQPVDRARPLG
ncbi:hypothetical protein [Streptacidiphilus melanogenes]|uniref:hypothetical protein n=1 Tax=Streptacidiphilus melanogenes TaxID=411235 RepID=UPI00126A0D02|nr:hypothetical protein [Streptacidiphilus melanogenes]